MGESHLRPQSPRISSTQRAQHGPHHNGKNALPQAQPKLGPQKPNRNGAHMARQAPPQKEDIDDARRPLFLLLDTIDALRLNAHLLIEPFLAAAQAAQEALLPLQLPREDLLSSARWFEAAGGAAGGDVGGGGRGLVRDAGLEVLLVNGGGVVAVDEIHCVARLRCARPGKEGRVK